MESEIRSVGQDGKGPAQFLRKEVVRNHQGVVLVGEMAGVGGD